MYCFNFLRNNIITILIDDNYISHPPFNVLVGVKNLQFVSASVCSTH